LSSLQLSKICKRILYLGLAADFGSYHVHLHAKVATMFRVQQRHESNVGGEEEEERYSCTMFVLDAMQASFRFNAKMSHTPSPKSLPPNVYIYTRLWTKFYLTTNRCLQFWSPPQKKKLLLVLFNLLFNFNFNLKWGIQINILVKY
jgi:hypothetical protein